jgi:hypothetical protein
MSWLSSKENQKIIIAKLASSARLQAANHIGLKASDKRNSKTCRNY